MTLRRRTQLQQRTPLVRRARLVAKKPLERTSELKRSAPLASVTPLKRSPMKRSRVEAKLTKQQAAPIVGRSGSICELQTVDCVYVAVDPCHRIGEGMGGRHGAAAVANDLPSVVLHGCRRCHDWTHRNVAAAQAEGWMLPRDADPLTTPVHYRRARWVLLDNDGGMQPCAAPADYREAS